MDPNLAKAAYSGNVELLREALATCQKSHHGDSTCCFLSQHNPNKSKKKEGGNIFHLAATTGKEDFIKEAIRILPDPLVHRLLTQQESGKCNPLHVAAAKGYLQIVKLILDFYANGSSKLEPIKPWLATDGRDCTPLHLALSNRKEECALEIMKVDKEDNSVLSLAVKNECHQVALEVLRSASSNSLSGEDRSTPLHSVTACSEEEVFRLLLERRPESIKAIDDTLLRKWTKADKLCLLEYILNNNAITPDLRKHLVDLIYKPTRFGNNLFHDAAKGRKVEAAKTLANVHREERRKASASRDLYKEANHHLHVPWLVPNNKDETPLGLIMADYGAAYDEYDRLKRDINDIKTVKCELLFLAIKKGLFHAADGIWHIQREYGWSIYPPQGREILHAASKYSEEVATWVAERWLCLITELEMKEEILLEASDSGLERLVKPLLKNHPDALRNKPEAWLEACKKGHFSTIVAFIDNCSYFREICLKIHNTPLHHINLENYEQHKKIVDHPIMRGLRNFEYSNGATPLHEAIKNRNILLTEVLLNTDGVNRSTKDKEGKTAMDLLIPVCHEDVEWDEMCKRNGIIPGLRITYFQDKNTLFEFRDSLSVVATLLATITFTAGFTLPGGVKSDSTGEATLADKAAFLVFLLANTFAMCCSMLVLICLLWSMVCDRDTSMLLVDKSMPVLMFALYNTLVAFMTGVYAVISYKSLWAAIIVIVICSISFIISCTRNIIFKNKKYKDENPNAEYHQLSEQRQDQIHGELGQV